jgi:pimeloyl-ACP methyl ester carboxylesterase
MGGDSEQGAVSTAELVREGDYWTVVFGDRELRVRDSKGMGYLAELLAHPGRDVAVLALAGGAPGERGSAAPAAHAGLIAGIGSDTGPVLDAQAKADYRERLGELRLEMDRANAFHDPERAAQARTEYEAIEDELRSAVGLGGRDRRAGSPTERARLNVARAIKLAVARLAELDGALGEHLSQCVHTGRVCAYRPEPSAAVTWNVSTRTSRTRLTRRFEPPETRYARSGNVSIAYQVLGDGPVDLVYVPGWLSHLDYQWADPLYTQLLRGLAGFCRLIIFDKRGIGLSDPVDATPTLEERMDDVRAVMEAVGSERAVLWGISEGGPIAALFAATYPQRVLGLVLYGTMAAGADVPGHPGRAELGRAQDRLRVCVNTAWGKGDSLEVIAPNLARSSLRRRGWGVFERAAASPAMAGALMEWVRNFDIRAALPSISAPTLVLHRTGDAVPIAMGRYLAERIPGARFVELAGDAHAPIDGDVEAIVEAVEGFVGGIPITTEPVYVLATVLALRITAATGWDSAMREEANSLVAAVGGTVLAADDNLVLARFDGPVRAIRCALRVVADLRELGSVLHAAVHTAQCELADDGLHGIAVDVATIAAAQAEPGELLASSTVRDLVLGSGIEFAQRGTCRVIDRREEMTLYAVGSAPSTIETPIRPLEPTLLDRTALGAARHAPGATRTALRLIRGKD